MTMTTATVTPIFTGLRPIRSSLRLDITISAVAGQRLDRSDLDQIIAIVRDPRPAIPRTVWVARVLAPARLRPRDAVMNTARAVIVAVRAYDYRVARGELAA
jgi:hypothetical protein